VNDAAAEALLHLDLDFVSGLLATPADGDDLDGRARFVGRRDQNAPTRELQLEGDAPGSVEDVHDASVLVLPADATDASLALALAGRARPVFDVDEGGVVERK
jgi:hypothetical protein